MGVLDRLNRGYASGGLVGGSAAGPAEPMKIELVNRSGARLSARDGGVSFDGRQYIQQVILDDVQRNGPIG